MTPLRVLWKRQQLERACRWTRSELERTVGIELAMLRVREEDKVVSALRLAEGVRTDRLIRSEIPIVGFAVRALGRMADGVLGDQQLAGQANERVDAIDIDAQRGFRRLGDQRAGRLWQCLGQSFDNSVDGLDHGLGVAGDQAALQRAFEIRHVQRPAVMAQHVGRDAACRFEPCGGGGFRCRLGEH